jgi:uncharacterized membrane protein YedE/YeeE
MPKYLSSLLAGLLFGLGLALAQMTDPAKVLGFLDVAGGAAWDPSLLFVLGGAVGLAALGFRLILAGRRPLFDSSFHLPTRRAIDAPLLLGSVLFGIGWGIGGYCPGPAIAQLAAPSGETWIFLPAMLLGIWLRHALAGRRRQSATVPELAEATSCG